MLIVFVDKRFQVFLEQPDGSVIRQCRRRVAVLYCAVDVATGQLKVNGRRIVIVNFSIAVW